MSSSYLVIHFRALGVDPLQMAILHVKSASIMEAWATLHPTCSSTSFPVAIARLFSRLAAPPNASRFVSISWHIY